MPLSWSAIVDQWSYSNCDEVRDKIWTWKKKELVNDTLDRSGNKYNIQKPVSIASFQIDKVDYNILQKSRNLSNFNLPHSCSIRNCDSSCPFKQNEYF